MKYRDDLKNVSPYADKIDELYKFNKDFYTPVHKKFQTWGIGKQFVFCLIVSLLILLFWNILKSGDIFFIFVFLFFGIAYNYAMTEGNKRVADKSSYNIVDIKVVDRIHDVEEWISEERVNSNSSIETSYSKRTRDIYFVVADGNENKLKVSRDFYYTLNTGDSYRILLLGDKILEIFEEISE